MPRDYTHTGDAFTRKVQAGEGPRTAALFRRLDTGRVYARRVRPEECQALRVRDLLRAVGSGRGHADALEGCGARVYWQAWEGVAVLLAEGERLPEGTPGGGRFLTLTYAPRGQARQDGTRGRAVLLRCPHCSRNVRAVYVSPVRADGGAALTVGDWRRDEAGEVHTVRGGGVWGCVRCLGLAYPSSQDHKTPKGDAAVLGYSLKHWRLAGDAAHDRAEARDRARFARFMRSD